MTMETINELMDAMIRGSLFGFFLSFWIMGLVAIWKWFLGLVKRFLHWLWPKWFKHQPDEIDKN